MCCRYVVTVQHTRHCHMATVVLVDPETCRLGLSLDQLPEQQQLPGQHGAYSIERLPYSQCSPQLATRSDGASNGEITRRGDTKKIYPTIYCKDAQIVFSVFGLI